MAKKAGACFGVNRSLDLVTQATTKFKKVVTLGDLIHNPATVAQLREEYGVVSVNSPSEAVECGADCVVVRSHGVTIHVEEELCALGIEVVDATCPHVKFVQKAAFELAKTCDVVVVVGRADHPEVRGVCSYIVSAGSTPVCISSQDELQQNLVALQKCNSVGVVSQTTQSSKTFQNIVNSMKECGMNPQVKNTICAATSQRQAAAEELSHNVDAFIIVGGKNSSNTTHLADIVAKNCRNTQHVESPDEIDFLALRNANTIGLSAGASTPRGQIEAIVDFLNSNL